MNALLTEVGTSLDPTLAIVLGLDYQGERDVRRLARIDARAKKTIGYHSDATGNPSTTAQETAARGEAGFLNPPTGVVAMEATVTSLHTKMCRYAVVAKAGHITYALMPPSPLNE